jgi:hypothetical protein
MSRSTDSLRRSASPRVDPFVPLIWTFDGPFGVCLADVEDTLRRAIVQLGNVAGLATALDLSLPALAARVAMGDRIQPSWSRFLDRVSQRYGLPSPLRVRHRKDAGPLATLVIVYRS